MAARCKHEWRYWETPEWQASVAADAERSRADDITAMAAHADALPERGVNVEPLVTLTLPLSSKQAQACVVAADAFGVEPWEIAVHALHLRQEMMRLADG